MKRFILALCTLLGAAQLSFGNIPDRVSLATLQYPPYEYEEQGKVRGLAVSLVREAFRRMGVSADIALIPFARAIKDLRTGYVDGLFTAFRTPEREEFADFSREVLVSQQICLFVREDSDVVFDGDLRKLASRRFGVVRKVSYGKVFDRAVAEEILRGIDEAESGEQNMAKLLRERFDILVSNRLGALFIMRGMGVEKKIRELQPSLDTTDSYMAFSKKKNLSELRDSFDKTLRQMKKDGTYRRIVESYE